MQTTPPVRPSIAIALVVADQARLACGRRWYPTSTRWVKTGGGSRLLEIPAPILATPHFGTRRVKMGGGSRLLEIPPPILATSHFKTGAPYSRRCRLHCLSLCERSTCTACGRPRPPPGCPATRRSRVRPRPSTYDTHPPPGRPTAAASRSRLLPSTAVAWGASCTI